MRVSLERRQAPPVETELLEIVTPRTNAATISAAENLFAALALPEPCGFEIAATHEARWFLVRAAGSARRVHLERQLAVAYPQAELRRLDLQRYPSLDPARPADDEQAAACALIHRTPPYLPLRTFRDADVDAARSAQADPVLGILGALGNLPVGWRGLAQLIVRPAPADWCRDYLRLAVEHPLAAEHAAARGDTSLTSVFLLAGLIGAGALAFQIVQWVSAGEWLAFAASGVGLGLALPGVIRLARHLNNRPVYDTRLVQEKIAHVAFQCELRLAVFAPSTVAACAVADQLSHLVAAYRQFSRDAGNSLIAHRLDDHAHDLRTLTPFLPVRALPILNSRELAGLWHLPQEPADLPFLERTTARRRLPLPATVTRGCRIGVSVHQNQTVPVALPDDLLRRHLLLVAKTRRGKSSLLLQLARDAMTRRPTGTPRPALFLVDPHRDLARAALGLVPPSRRNDVVALDLAEAERPFGLNLIDVGLGWSRDKAVANALAIFRREFDRFWGPRMEDAFRFALLTLFEVNQAICAADPTGSSRQHTILDVPAVLVDAAFRRSLLGLVTDPIVKAWWSGYFDLLDRRLQIEIVNPVQTKVQRFAGSIAARAVVGQPRSTIDPGAWVREGKIVVVDTAKGIVGEDTAALIGATLLNLVGLAIADQAALDPVQRRPVTVVVDEFHSLPGADYEAILAELAKYGANLVLATQSLARLDALDREQHRALRATVFANLDGLFAFHTSAEDARYLVPELGGEVDQIDLVALGEYQCYAKLSTSGERLPTFSVRLDPPPAGDSEVAASLTRESAIRYGRPRRDVECDVLSALARIAQSHRQPLDSVGTASGQTGVARDASIPRKNEESKAAKPSRTANRPRRNAKLQAQQKALFELPAMEESQKASTEEEHPVEDGSRTGAG
jgi:hypothetical protein